MKQAKKDALLDHLEWANQELKRVIRDLKTAADRVDFARSQVVLAAQRYADAEVDSAEKDPASNR